MASAVIGGLVASGRSAASILVVEPFEAQRERLRSAHGVNAIAAADASLAQAALVVWAVKPQLFRRGRRALRAHIGQRAAAERDGGHPQRRDRAAAGTERVVRAMPNTPALIGQGIAGLYARAAVTAADRALVEQVLAPTGRDAVGRARGRPRRRDRAVGLGPGLRLLLRRGDDRGRRRDGPVRRAGQAARAGRRSPGRPNSRAARASRPNCCASASRPRAERRTPRSPRSKPQASRRRSSGR